MELALNAALIAEKDEEVIYWMDRCNALGAKYDSAASAIFLAESDGAEATAEVSRLRLKLDEARAGEARATGAAASLRSAATAAGVDGDNTLASTVARLELELVTRESALKAEVMRVTAEQGGAVRALEAEAAGFRERNAALEAKLAEAEAAEAAELVAMQTESTTLAAALKAREAELLEARVAAEDAVAALALAAVPVPITNADGVPEEVRGEVNAELRDEIHSLQAAAAAASEELLAAQSALTATEEELRARIAELEAELEATRASAAAEVARLSKAEPARYRSPRHNLSIDTGARAKPGASLYTRTRLSLSIDLRHEGL